VVYALLISTVCHILGSIAALGVLQPGLDIERPILERAFYVSENPIAWRVGWLTWQLTAASNLFASVTIVLYFFDARRRQIPGAGKPLGWAVVALICTVAAVVPEQWGEFALVTEFVDTARQAVSTGDSTIYLQEEIRWITMTTVCGACGYTLMLLAWIACAVSYHGKPRSLWWFWLLGISDFVLFTLSYFACWISCQSARVDGVYEDFHYVVLFNAMAFPLLVIWMLALITVLGNRHHAFFSERSDQLHQVRWPAGQSGAKIARLLHAPGLRDILRSVFGIFKMPVLKSDIRNVLYVNWLVPTPSVSRWLPHSLAADDLQGMTVISILTYQHGNFGPALLGPLRRWLPSPQQSNWRLYLNEQSAEGSIYFIKVCLDSGLHVFGSRLMSDGLASHRCGEFEYGVDPGGGTLRLTADGGSAPELDLKFNMDPGYKRDLPSSWEACFDDWEAAVVYLTEQNRAVDTVGGWRDELSADIRIPMDLRQIQPVQIPADIHCPLLAELDLHPADLHPFAFLVPEVTFEFLGESYR